MECLYPATRYLRAIMIFLPADSVSVGPSDMIPVSEKDVGINWKIPSNMYVALK